MSLAYGWAISTVRSARGLSQSALANAAELDGSYVSLIENGHRLPSLESIERIAAELNFPLFALVALATAREHRADAGALDALLGRLLLDPAQAEKGGAS